MAYYLKKTKLKGRTYLSIDESFYSHEKKGTAHRCYKSLGSVETWIQKGMDDPISSRKSIPSTKKKPWMAFAKFPTAPPPSIWAISPSRPS